MLDRDRSFTLRGSNNGLHLGQWSGGSGSPVVDPRQTDWDLVAGIITRNFEETGRWFL